MLEWRFSASFILWGIPVPQVFQECGVPPKAMARAHRALAPMEEVGRRWTAAAGVEEEQPTTAAGNSLPRMVSWGVWGGWVGRRVGVGWVGGQACGCGVGG